MADGTLRFDTKIDTEGLEKGTKTVKGALNSFINSISSTGRNMSNAFDGGSSKAVGLGNKIKQTQAEIDVLNSKMGELANKEMPSDQFISTQKEIDKTGQKLETLLNRQEKMESLGTGQDTKAWKSTQFDIDQTSSKLTRLEQAMENLKSNGGATALGSQSAEYQKMQSRVEKLRGKLQQYNTQATELSNKNNEASKSLNKTSKSMDKVHKSASKGTKSTSKFSKTLSMLGKSLMFSLVFRAFSAVTKSIKEGFQNLAQYSTNANQNLSALQTSLLTLKNSFATAFSPILTAITPALQTFINYLSQAITTAGQFFAVFLNGATTFTKAKDAQVDYAKSLKNTAKEADNALSPIDKLNNVSDSASPTADTPGTPSTSEMFEEVEIDSKLIDTVNKFKESLSTLFEPIKTSWDTYGAGAIESVKGAFNGIKELIGTIGNSFKTVWTNGTGTKVIDNILLIFTNINGIIKNIANNFKKAWETDGKGTQIVQDIFNILNNVLTLIKDVTQATKDWASGLDFTPLLTSFQNFTSSLDPLTGTIADALLWFYTNVLLPLAGWVITDIIPLFFDGLAAVLDIANGVIEALKPSAEWLFENLLKPLAEWTGGAITDILGFIVDKLQAFGDWINKHQTAVENIAIAIGSFILAWKLVEVATIIGGIVTALVGFVATGGLATVIAGALGAAIAFLTSPVTIVIAIIGALIAIIVLLVKNWDKVKEFGAKCWEGIKSAWNGAGSWFGDKVVKPIGDFFVNLWEGIKTGVATAVEKVKTTWNNIGTWFSEKVIKPVGDFFTNLWTGIKTGVSTALDTVKKTFKSIFESLVDIVKKPINAIIDCINGMIGGVVDGVNSVIRAINSISFTIPDWVPGIGGKGIGFNVKEFTAPKIPRLATGMVIPPNSEFAAILGDQKKGINIEAPLQTIVDAFKAVTGGSGNGTELHLHVYEDGKQRYETVVRYEKENYGKTGKSVFVH